MRDLRVPLVPAQVEPYVAALGVEDAIAFLMAFGGTEIYLTCDPKSRSRVVALVGHRKAVALARLAERLPRRVPLAKPWIAALWYARGLSKAEIARRLHASDVAVRGWLKGAGAPGSGRRGDGPAQLSLF